MSRFLVDTDWLIDVLHGQESAIQTLVRLAPEGLAVCLITYGELFEGAYYARNQERDLLALRHLLMDKDILPLTAEIMQRFAILRGGLPRHQRQQLGDMDLLIAATALTYDLTLLTRNLQDFQIVPELRLYRDPATS